jgi:hypothetical protein
MVFVVRRWTAAIVLVAACDPSAETKAEDPAEAKAEAEEQPAVAETETVVDRAALAALCIRSALAVPLDGEIETGVLIDKKDGTKRFGWVAGVLKPSAFDKIDAEQAARMLEVQLKTADAMQAQFAGTCTEALEGSNPVVVTFTIEHEPTDDSTKAGYWVVAGDTRKRDIEFVAETTAVEARKKALGFALEASGVAELAKGSTRDRGKGSTVLCPEQWADALP